MWNLSQDAPSLLRHSPYSKQTELTLLSYMELSYASHAAARGSGLVGTGENLGQPALPTSGPRL